MTWCLSPGTSGGEPRKRLTGWCFQPTLNILVKGPIIPQVGGQLKFQPMINLPKKDQVQSPSPSLPNSMHAIPTLIVEGGPGWWQRPQQQQPPLLPLGWGVDGPVKRVCEVSMTY